MASSPSRRLFLGLMADEPVRQALVKHMRLWSWPASARLVSPDRLHLTLHFLGQVQAGDEQALLEALPAVAMEPLDLVLDTPHAFGGSIAVLLARPDDRLVALHRRFAPALQRIGQELPEIWTPHVTLARKAQGARRPANPPPIAWRVREFALVWSKLTQPTGYHVLARYGT